MADAPYLIAIALLEQQGERAMPLQGKSLRQPIEADGDPGELGERLVYELLLRVWQRSDQGPLQRAQQEDSLLLVQVPIEALQTSLPAIKADWINKGDAAALRRALSATALAMWRLELPHRQKPQFIRLMP